VLLHTSNGFGLSFPVIFEKAMQFFVASRRDSAKVDVQKLSHFPVILRYCCVFAANNSPLEIVGGLSPVSDRFQIDLVKNLLLIGKRHVNELINRGAGRRRKTASAWKG
jgi:hypothetical protein